MTPLSRATRGYLNGPLAIATAGLITLGTNFVTPGIAAISVNGSPVSIEKAQLIAPGAGDIAFSSLDSSVVMDYELNPGSASTILEGLPVVLARNTQLAPLWGTLPMSGCPVFIAGATDTYLDPLVADIAVQGSPMLLGGNQTIHTSSTDIVLECGDVEIGKDFYLLPEVHTVRVKGLRVKTSVSIPPTFWSEEQPEQLPPLDVVNKPEIYE